MKYSTSSAGEKNLNHEPEPFDAKEKVKSKRKRKRNCFTGLLKEAGK